MEATGTNKIDDPKPDTVPSTSAINARMINRPYFSKSNNLLAVI